MKMTKRRRGRREWKGKGLLRVVQAVGSRIMMQKKMKMKTQDRAWSPRRRQQEADVPMKKMVLAMKMMMKTVVTWLD